MRIVASTVSVILYGENPFPLWLTVRLLDEPMSTILNTGSMVISISGTSRRDGDDVFLETFTYSMFIGDSLLSIMYVCNKCHTVWHILLKFP